MSEDVLVKGKLTPVILDGMTTEEKAYDLIPESNRGEIESYGYDSAIAYLTTEMDYYYDSDSETLFEISQKKSIEGSFIDMVKNPDGTIDFITLYYNGGAHLSEMLNDGFDQL